MSLGRLPSFLQRPITWITGAPLPGQRPLFRHTAFSRGLVAVLQFFFGLALATLAVGQMPWALPLILPAWVLVTHAARYLQVVLLHHLSHRPPRGWPRLVFEIVSSVLVITPYDAYRETHLGEHHSRSLGSSGDADARLLASLGFRAGMSREALWRHLNRSLVSPRFHGVFLATRLRSNFVAAPLPRLLLAGGVQGGIVVAVFATGAWLTWIIGFVLPVVVFYQASALLQLVCEHRWFEQRGARNAREHLARLTFGRFCGEAAPFGLGARAWLRFAWRISFVHLPVRLLVLVGDMPHHDAHHRRPTKLDWPNSIWARQQDLEARTWPEPYDEIWGLGRAIDEVFTGMSRVSDPS
jgi:hypothetical protein